MRLSTSFIFYLRKHGKRVARIRDTQNQVITAIAVSGTLCGFCAVDSAPLDAGLPH